MLTTKGNFNGMKPTAQVRQLEAQTTGLRLSAQLNEAHQ
jgi:hypothetical protein